MSMQIQAATTFTLISQKALGKCNRYLFLPHTHLTLPTIKDKKTASIAYTLLQTLTNFDNFHFRN